MTRQQFIKQFGEDPVDVLGEDWENYLEEFLEERENKEFGMTYGEHYEDDIKS